METIDWIMFGFIIAIIFMAVLTIYVQKAFIKKNEIYSLKQSSQQKTGAEVARVILSKNGITNIKILSGKEGKDHYNPKTQSISLSPSVYNSSSVSSMAIAAHECGHAIQWHRQERTIKLRDVLVKPVGICTQIGSAMFSMGMMLLLMSMLMGSSSSMIDSVSIWITFGGLIMYGAMGLFQFVTLPVEFGASRKAKKQLEELGFMVTKADKEGTKAVLNAAAMTYVVAFLTTATMLALFILRLLMMMRR